MSFVIPSRWIRRRIATQSVKQFEAQSAYMGMMHERLSVSGALLTRLFGLHDRNLRDFTKQTTTFRRLGMQANCEMFRHARPLRLAKLEQGRATVRSAHRCVSVPALPQCEADHAPVPVDAAIEIGNPQGDAHDVHPSKLTG